MKDRLRTLTHLRHQAPVIGALGGTAFAALRQRLGAAPLRTQREVRAEISPRPRALIEDFIRFSGGDPADAREELPPTMFPQWAFPMLAKTLRGIEHPIARVLNAGCRIEINAPLPPDEPLLVRAELAGVDDDERRVLIRQRLWTGPRSRPDALVAEVQAIIPLKRNGAKKESPVVEQGAVELERINLSADEGLRFALLTGDFNPIHWIKPYARAAGFSSTILHGFATFAKAYEALRAHRRGEVGTNDIASIGARFTRPLPLPKEVGVYTAEDRLQVGSGVGDEAYLTGSFVLRSEERS